MDVIFSGVSFSRSSTLAILSNPAPKLKLAKRTGVAEIDLEDLKDLKDGCFVKLVR